MAEILEYALVALVSSIFVAGSLGSYGAFTSFESNLQLKTAFTSVSNVAYSATLHGSSMAILDFSQSSTLSCAHGKLSLSAGSFVATESIPQNCQFSINLGSGVNHVVFFVRDSNLTASVS